MAHAKTRGILAVRAQGDVKAVLENLNADWQSFKEQHRAELEEVRAAADDANNKLAAMQMNGTGGGTAPALTPTAAAEFTDFLKAGNMAGLEPRADMQSGSSADGGATIPKQISSTILDQMADMSPMRRLATVERATTSDFTKIVGLRGATSGWAAETDPRSITETPKMGEVSPTMGELFVYAEATRWVLEDSQFNLERWLSENIATEFAVQEGTAFFAGDGSNKPTGFLTKPRSTDADDTRAFGNWRSGYLIADRTQMRMLRDPYTRLGWVRFYAHHRVGGDVLDSNAVQLLEHPAA